MKHMYNKTDIGIGGGTTCLNFHTNPKGEKTNSFNLIQVKTTLNIFVISVIPKR